MLKLPFRASTGSRIGEEVLQLYIHDLVASRVRPVRELKGFQKAPFQKKTKGVVQKWGRGWGWILMGLKIFGIDIHNLKQLSCFFLSQKDQQKIESL